MRTAFIRSLEEQAALDDRVMLVVGDLGFGVVESFADRFPSRYINAGVAEQNMTGIAAGMALEGNVVFTYSIANFPTLRCLEQIRNDICYHNADVKIVSVGGGFAYGSLGMTHHATEDIAIMRALPNMTVISPGDPVEAAAATCAAIVRPGPCYIRLGRAGERVVHEGTIDFRIGEAIEIVDGQDITLIATGSILTRAVDCAKQLLTHGISTRVLSMHTIKPLDTAAIYRAISQTSAVATLEEHSVIGGLGSAVAHVLAEYEGRKIPFTSIGLESTFVSTGGDQEYLRNRFGLSTDAICTKLTKLISDL